MLSLRQWVRDSSAPLHERVDAAFSRFDLSDRHEYGRFLRAHGMALFDLEAALEQGGIERLLTDWPERRRSAALREDLQALELGIPTPLGVEPGWDEGWHWGVAYVLEGSRLGGRVLSQCVREGLGDAPLRYLAHGQGTPLWPRFLEQFEQHAPSIDRTQLSAGVHAAFEQFLHAAAHELQALAPAGS